MAPAQPPPPPAPSSSSTTLEPHRMRIATQGHLRTYVAFALRFLQDNPPRALELHTLPPPGSTSSKTRASTTTTIPMLISTVEVIKREYLLLLSSARETAELERRRAKGKGKAVPEEDEGDVEMAEGNEGEARDPGEVGAEEGQGKWWDRGLFQYNETGCLEDLSGYGDRPGEGGGERMSELEEAERELDRLKDVLGGKVGLKMHHTPYLFITLATVPLPDLAARSRVTTQEIKIPLRPARSKSQAHRRRKRLAKEAKEAIASAEAETGAETTVGIIVENPVVDAAVRAEMKAGPGVGGKKLESAGGGKKRASEVEGTGVAGGAGKAKKRKTGAAGEKGKVGKVVA